jgi:hypothetical protein
MFNRITSRKFVALFDFTQGGSSTNLRMVSERFRGFLALFLVSATEQSNLRGSGN